MKNILADLLPSGFKPSPIVKGGWEKVDMGIARTISVEKRSFSGVGEKWCFVISLDFKSKYFPDPDFYSHICDASVSAGVVCSRENVKILDAWGDDEELEFGNALSSIIIPWVEKFGDPVVFVDFLTRAQVIGIDGKDSEHLAIYGDVIAALQYHPPRLRKQYDAYLASVYEDIGETEKALECLSKYKLFYEKDGTAEPEAKANVIGLIDQGIKILNGKKNK